MDGGIFDLLLDGLPLWAVGILMVALCLLARRGGMLLRAKYAPDSAPAEASDANDYIIGAIFGLLAFMLALTFSIAIERFDSRRALVSEEANAIRSLYVTAQILDEPYSGNIRGSLHEYAQTRIAPRGLWSGDHDQKLGQSRQLRLVLARQVQAAVMPIRDTDLATYLIETTNEMLSVGSRRELLARAHIPTRILDVLMLYTLASATVLGFLVSGTRPGTRHASNILLLLYCIAFLLIIDLDRPRAGTVKVPQTALEELLLQLDALEGPDTDKSR